MTSRARTSAFVCLFCGLDLNSLEQHTRQAHYDAHLSEPGPSARAYTAHVDLRASLTKYKFAVPPSSLPQRAQPGHQADMGFFSSSEKGKSTQDAFWHPSLDVPPPPHYSPGA